MSQFSEAIMASMTANLDPMNGIVRDYAAKQLEVVNDQSIRSRLDLVDDLGKRINEAKANESDGRVVESLQRMLKSIT